MKDSRVSYPSAFFVAELNVRISGREDSTYLWLAIILKSWKDSWEARSHPRCTATRLGGCLGRSKGPSSKILVASYATSSTDHLIFTVDAWTHQYMESQEDLPSKLILVTISCFYQVLSELYWVVIDWFCCNTFNEEMSVSSPPASMSTILHPPHRKFNLASPNIRSTCSGRASYASEKMAKLWIDRHSSEDLVKSSTCTTRAGHGTSPIRWVEVAILGITHKSFSVCTLLLI